VRGREVELDATHRMELQYDGTGLHGWSKQEGLPTVEGCLEKAFATVLGSIPALRAAGRTDAGVHARRQVVSLRLPPETDLVRLATSLNALTPSGIVVTRIARAPDDFDARKDAASRVYRYLLSTAPAASPFVSRYCWQRPGKLDRQAMNVAAEATMGRHDFSAFTPAQTEHVFFDRTVNHCVWRQATMAMAAVGGRGIGSGLLCLEIEANAFLRHMVRAIVGTMVEVGEGKRDVDSFRRLLGGGFRDKVGPTAPAHGLFLWDVRYRSGRRPSEREDGE
jgi:tRNA pseudouridine38-40 synthase